MYMGIVEDFLDSENEQVPMNPRQLFSRKMAASGGDLRRKKQNN